MSNPASFSLTPGKRVLFLTKDLGTIRRQLRGELSLTMDQVRVEDLLDDINTDVMTPAWVCFDYKPELIARNAYAGLMDKGERVFAQDALKAGGFEVIVAGQRKGTGSSRETAVQAEKWCGIRLSVAASFAPIHARNLINQGVLMADHAMLARLMRGEAIPLAEFTRGHDPITAGIIEAGGLFPYSRRVAEGSVRPPSPATRTRPMTMAEKVIARHLVGGEPGACVAAGDAAMVKVDGGYSHEFTTAQVHQFLVDEFGPDYRLGVEDPRRFAVFEDHLIYATGVPRMAPHAAKIEELRRMQRVFQAHTGVRDYCAVDGVSPGICHQVAREEMILPGDFYQATDSHTCMGGGSNALAYGVGATEYAALVYSGATSVVVPESIRFELHGAFRPGVTAKDLILRILATFAKEEATLDRVMEFGGPGLAGLSMDERATLANMATECSAKGAMIEADAVAIDWIAARRRDQDPARLRARAVAPDAGATYQGGVHRIDLGTIEPMVARPGDPTYGVAVGQVGEVRIDIAYGGSCTAGKDDDIDFYAQVMAEALRAGRTVADGVTFFIQFGSQAVEDYARRKGYLELFAKAGVKILTPGCGACIGCGPGVSDTREQVTVSAINRNFQGRSGPGQLYLASPLTVAASAVTGRLTAWREGLFHGA